MLISRINIVTKNGSIVGQDASEAETEILIPAYNSAGEGLIVDLKLKAKGSKNYHIETNGVVANALSRSLNRCIETMSLIKQKWKLLASLQYILECDHNNFDVKDARSSSLALCIGLINIHRSVHGHCQSTGITGSGILRADGSFDKTNLEYKKHQAAKNSYNGVKFLNSAECNHIFELDEIMNNSFLYK